MANEHGQIAIDSESASTILFGAFDRHNFGDLLFPHIAARLLAGRELFFAGLLDRDMRSYGGHQVRGIRQLANNIGDTPVNLIHIGGELLTCDAWQAAVMLQSEEEIGEIIRSLDGQPSVRAAWANSLLRKDGEAAYTVSRTLLPSARKIFYNAVGGVDFTERSDSFRSEVIANLQEADWVTVRDLHTQQTLDAFGVASQLAPDPAVMVAELFGGEISVHGRRGEVSTVIDTFPQGYLAVQFSADFGDDTTLSLLAAQLDGVADMTGYGVVLFRAGAAPWHDDLECYQRLTSYMRCTSVAIFKSLHLWDICAVIAHSRGYCGSSLHGRIVAMAYALPRVNLCHPLQEGRITKQVAYASSWDLVDCPAVIGVDNARHGIDLALDVAEKRRQDLAAELVKSYRNKFGMLQQML